MLEATGDSRGGYFLLQLIFNWSSHKLVIARSAMKPVIVD